LARFGGAGLQHTTPTPRAQDIPERLHLALIKITTPQLLDNSVINGVDIDNAESSRKDRESGCSSTAADIRFACSIAVCRPAWPVAKSALERPSRRSCGTGSAHCLYGRKPTSCHGSLCRFLILSAVTAGSSSGSGLKDNPANSFVSARAGLPTVLSRKVLLSALQDGHVVLVPPIAYTEENPRAG
jgi:amino-acid N-acetyltransferase